MIHTKKFFFAILVTSFASNADAVDLSALQTKRKTKISPPAPATYCFGKARCFELASKMNRLHAVERLEDTPFKVTEINIATFDIIKKGASDFEEWAKKASAGSKSILGCRHEFSVTESKTTRTVCLDSINDKERSQRSKSFISLFTQAKAVAAPSPSAAAGDSTANPLPKCGPGGPKEDEAECVLEEIPQFPGKKQRK